MSEERVSEESLRELLGRVHERLRQTGSVDPESRKLLAMLMRDIDRTLGRGGAREGEGAGQHAPRLESLAVRFEADHPGLAEVIREVIDALVRVGI